MTVADKDLSIAKPKPAGEGAEIPNNFREKMGIRLESRERGFASLSCMIREDLLNGGGIAHGGVLMALADTAMGECFSHREDKRSYVTTDISYRFLDRAMPGDKVVATARTLRQGGRIMTASCRLTVNGRLIGYASGSFYVLSD